MLLGSHGIFVEGCQSVRISYWSMLTAKGCHKTFHRVVLVPILKQSLEGKFLMLKTKLSVSIIYRGPEMSGGKKNLFKHTKISLHLQQVTFFFFVQPLEFTILAHNPYLSTPVLFQSISFVGYRHGGCCLSCRVTSLRGMLGVRRCQKRLDVPRDTKLTKTKPHHRTVITAPLFCFVFYANEKLKFLIGMLSL